MNQGYSLFGFFSSLLGLTDYGTSVRKIPGPSDFERTSELSDLEKQIADPERYKGLHYQLAEDCLRAALLCRQLERPRTEIDGQFARAGRAAQKASHPQQLLRIGYERALTALWWFDDFDELNRLYDDVEALALSSNQATDLHRLGTLLTLLQHIVRTDRLPRAEAKLDERTSAIKTALNQMSADQTRPANALSATTDGLLLDLTAAVGDPVRIASVLRELNGVILAADGLPGFPLTTVVTMLMELGRLLPDNPAYDELFESITSVMSRRVSEAEAGRLLSQRGFQKLKIKKPYEAIRMFGRAQRKLAVREQRGQFITALVGCGLAYMRVGLPWAARANFLAATNQAMSEYWEDETVLPAVLPCLQKLVWVELQLGRVPCALQWIEVALAVAFSTGTGDAATGEEAPNERTAQDRSLGMLLLRADVSELQAIEFLPEILDQLGLDYSQMALLYALGYEDHLRTIGIIPEAEDEKAVSEFFGQWLTHPAAELIADLPELLRAATINLRSRVLGCELVAKVGNTLAGLYLGEAILAALEALLATSLETTAGVFPHVSEFRIELVVSDLVTGQLEFHFVESDAHVVIKHSPDNSVRVMHDPVSFQTWLQKIVVQIAARVLTAENMSSYAQQLFGEEEGFGRALSLADPSIPITNIVGDAPKFFLADWQSLASTRRFPLRRTTGWRNGGEHAKPTASASTPNNGAANEKPASDGISHGERRVFSLINMSLWSSAKWNSTLYLLPIELDQLPLLAIGFANADAGKAIFREWREKLGAVDEHDQLHISIVTGIKRHLPFAYRVILGTNPRIPAQRKFREIVQVSRINEMKPPDSKNLDGFVQRLSGTQRYQIVPALYQAGKEPQVFYDLWLGKQVLEVRPAWQVSLSDSINIGIHADDDPIIPADVTDAPVLRVLERARQRKATSS